MSVAAAQLKRGSTSLFATQHSALWASSGSSGARKFVASSRVFPLTATPSGVLCCRLRTLLTSGGVKGCSVIKDVRHATWAFATFASQQDQPLADIVLQRAANDEKAEPHDTAELANERVDASATSPSTTADTATPPANDAALAAVAVDGETADSNAPPRKKKFKRRKYSRPPKPKVDPADVDIADVVCPLRNMPYSEQLQQKQGRVVEALQRITDKVRGKSKNAGVTPEWLTPALESDEKLCCPLLGIVRSPQRDGYRNKCEFTIGTSPAGDPTVGFLLGGYMDGYTEVAEPRGCVHVPDTTLEVAQWATEYFRTHTQLPVWDKRINNGFWRLLTVREGRSATWMPRPGEAASSAPSFGEFSWRDWLVDLGRAGASGEALEAAGGAGLTLQQIDALTEAQAPPCDELLVMVQINPAYTSAEVAAAECDALGRHLLQRAAEASQPVRLRCLLVQQHAGISNAAQADAPVLPMLAPEGASGAVEHGEEYISDSLCNLTFRVSAGAFFQVNNGAAAVLYELAGNWASVDGGGLLFDVCCGTGTIGLSLAHRVREVVGVELVEQAIQDAHVNAQFNGITNCTWVCDKAEVAMRQLLEALPPASGAAAPADAGTAASGAQPEAQEQAYRTQHSEFSEVVAIVDPPRSGLHPKVLKALLRCPQLRRIVYVSCNPESMAANCVELCSPPQPADFQSTTYKRMRSTAGTADVPPPWEPFRPVRAVAVDLFPHTKHCEAVMLLER